MFDLREYVPQIVAMAESHNCEAQDAVDMFIVNLRTLRDSNKGADSLNFRELGQKWNALPNKTRNQQRVETISLVSKKLLPPSRPRRGM